MATHPVEQDSHTDISREATAHPVSPVDAILYRLRTAVEQAGEEIRHYSLSLNTSYENWTSQYSQACQRQIDTAQQHAQFVFQDRNQEVLAINSMLRRELDEVRGENAAYKQQLIQRDQESHIIVIGEDDDHAGLPAKKKLSADQKTKANTGVSKAGLKKGKGHKRSKGKQAE